MMITETRLNPNSISNVDLKACLFITFFHTDPPTTAGGRALYVSKDLKVIPRSDLRIDLPRVESCWVEIDHCNNKKHMVGCV